MHELIQSIGALVNYLLTDLNPIEGMFLKVKACLCENDTAIKNVDEMCHRLCICCFFQQFLKKIYLNGMNTLPEVLGMYMTRIQAIFMYDRTMTVIPEIKEQLSSCMHHARVMASIMPR